MADDIKRIKRIAAKLAHFDGADPVETHKDEAIWEQMFSITPMTDNMNQGRSVGPQRSQK